MADDNGKKRRYLISSILPARQVHIIGGSSGVGKTRWFFASMKSWIKGEPVLGFASHPEPAMYFATDRNSESLMETLANLDALDIIPWKSIINSNKSIEDIIIGHPGVKVFIFDSIMTFVPGHKFNDYGVVSQFMRELTYICEKRDVTIIGMVHTTKLKENAAFLNPREKLLGSAAWAGYAETLFVLTSENLDNPGEEQTRCVHVLPRNYKEFKTYWNFVNGVPTVCENPSKPKNEYANFINSIPPYQVIGKDRLLEIATRLNLSRATVTRYLKQAVENYDLRKVRYGYYERILVIIDEENDPENTPHQ